MGLPDTGDIAHKKGAARKERVRLRHKYPPGSYGPKGKPEGDDRAKRKKTGSDGDLARTFAAGVRGGGYG